MRAAALTGQVESTDGLDLAMAARRKVAQTEAAQFDAILAYLDQTSAESLAQSGGINEWTRYGGSGTPSVSEYTVAKVGPALGVSTNGGRKLIADALDLAYRLPTLFGCLHDGTVDAWRIRNGHRLCRFHHRAKTFTGWSVSSPAPGIWIWTSTDGRTYLVTGGTTTKLPGTVTTSGSKPPKTQRRLEPATTASSWRA